MTRTPAERHVDTPALLTGAQAAAYLGVSHSVLKELTREGWIPVVVLRHGIRRDLRRWSRASLDELIRQREQGGQLLRIAQGVEHAMSREARSRPITRSSAK